VRAYYSLARVSAKNALAYRTDFVFALSGIVFQFVAMLAVWRVLTADSSASSFTWPQMCGYLLVAFASGALVGLFADYRMAYRIRDGLVSLDLIKPVRYQEARFAETLGGVSVEIFVVLVVGLVTAFAVGSLPLPAGADLALFVVSLVLLIVLKFLVVYLCGMACFWTENYIGVQWARIAVVNLFSGALVPLEYLPHWLGTIAVWSPFAGMASTPGLIFIGRSQGGAALLLVLVQLGWAVILWFGAKLLWRTAVRHLTVNGG
jgi:viologen exporter family transport system permease protein